MPPEVRIEMLQQPETDRLVDGAQQRARALEAGASRIELRFDLMKRTLRHSNTTTGQLVKDALRLIAESEASSREEPLGCFIFR